jgi:predicted alpha/beta superfamily hydrolase
MSSVSRGAARRADDGRARAGRPQARGTARTPDLAPQPALGREQIEAATPGLSHSLTGDIRLHRAFPSRVLGRARDVLVYLPPGYESEPGRRYPVFYVQDGQNVFDGATSYVPGQEWQLDEAAERLITAGALPPLIIVAINHAGERRLDEFAPTRDPRRRAGGSADLYGRMLTDELKPFVDRTYRTLPGPGHTGVGGSSMGGLVSLYLGLTHPGVFGHVAALSPSAWWDHRVILRTVRALRWRPRLRVWLDIGTAEGRSALEDVRALRSALVAAGWREDEDLAYREEPDAPHSEVAWAARVEPMLRFLFR